MKIIIMYRTAMYAGIIASAIKNRNSEEFRKVNGLILDFNKCDQFSLGEEKDTYSVLIE